MNKSNNIKECLIWHWECKRINNCRSRNLSRINAILWLSNLEGDKDLHRTITNMLNSIEYYLSNAWFSDIQKRAVMHYLRNWVWPQLDNTFMDFTIKWEDRKMLIDYLFNAHRITLIRSIISSLPNEKLIRFSKILFNKYHQKSYKMDLRDIIKLLKSI